MVEIVGYTRRAAARIAIPLLSLAILLALWWLVVELEVWSELFVPSPARVWERLQEGLTTHDGQVGLSGYYLYEHLWASLWRILRGVAFALVFGVVLGLLLATVKPFRLVVEPYVNFVRALPPLAYFSLLIIWFGIEDTSKVWLLFLAAFPPIALSVVAGVEGIRRERIDAARALGASRWQVVRFVTLPSVLPQLFTGTRLALGFAWTTIVAAETVDGIPGIGGLAWATKKFQQTDVAVLCIIVIGLTAIALDQLVKQLEKRVLPWHGRA
ncbi:ABC transporter permease [Conexibacter stalactiti]|uniref:ABC transporter permease n=1 Tax=Conexibacter stalactiti TaxID=1940611 RepID=A0ABU4HXF7_9ACTN|nr:ABC transporter permease [Conexibacter stalactiti]MDW5598007.1 ABC transporter permease [Conexibacter stalactiti]MEC5038649.1 ABC transporter permease [Conexibacter stalactiti]